MTSSLEDPVGTASDEGDPVGHARGSTAGNATDEDTIILVVRQPVIVFPVDTLLSSLSGILASQRSSFWIILIASFLVTDKFSWILGEKYDALVRKQHERQQEDVPGVDIIGNNHVHSSSNVESSQSTTIQLPRPSCATVMQPNIGFLALNLVCGIVLIVVAFHRCNKGMLEKSVRTFDAVIIISGIARMALGSLLNYYGCFNMNAEESHGVTNAAIVLTVLLLALQCLLLPIPLVWTDALLISLQSKKCMCAFYLMWFLLNWWMNREEGSGGFDDTRVFNLGIFEPTARESYLNGIYHICIIICKHLIMLSTGTPCVVMRSGYNLLQEGEDLPEDIVQCNLQATNLAASDRMGNLQGLHSLQAAMGLGLGTSIPGSNSMIGKQHVDHNVVRHEDVFRENNDHRATNVHSVTASISRIPIRSVDQVAHSDPVNSSNHAIKNGKIIMSNVVPDRSSVSIKDLGRKSQHPSGSRTFESVFGKNMFKNRMFEGAHRENETEIPTGAPTKSPSRSLSKNVMLARNLPGQVQEGPSHLRPTVSNRPTAIAIGTAQRRQSEFLPIISKLGVVPVDQHSENNSKDQEIAESANQNDLETPSGFVALEIELFAELLAQNSVLEVRNRTVFSSEIGRKLGKSIYFWVITFPVWQILSILQERAGETYRDVHEHDDNPSTLKQPPSSHCRNEDEVLRYNLFFHVLQAIFLSLLVVCVFHYVNRDLMWMSLKTFDSFLFFTACTRFAVGAFANKWSCHHPGENDFYFYQIVSWGFIYAWIILFPFMCSLDALLGLPRKVKKLLVFFVTIFSILRTITLRLTVKNTSPVDLYYIKVLPREAMVDGYMVTVLVLLKYCVGLQRGYDMMIIKTGYAITWRKRR